MSEYTVSFKNPIIYNPVTRTVHEDNPSMSLEREDFEYGNTILNAKRYHQIKKENKSDDPLKITDVFYNNGNNSNYADQANDYYSKLNEARTNQDKSLAAAIITSKEYTLLQDSVVLGTNEEVMKEGILVSLFEEIATPNLTGKWAAFAQDLKWHTNLAETESPEPSLGKSTETTIEVPKHGGAVAITERARQVINGADVFARLVRQIQSKRLESENEMVADEIESNTAHSITGVDWGARSSGVSSNNPLDKFNEFRTTFSTLSGQPDLFISGWLGYAELFQNDFIKGTQAPLQPIATGTFGESVASFPLINGIRYVTDNAIDSTTAGWLLASSAIKIFRGPSRAYTVTNPQTETEEYVTKTHFLPETVNSDLIYTVTGITA
jgi:hypothetical protein